MSEEQNEKELLTMFVKLCQTVRDPRNRKSRAEMAIPAARWELTFKARLEELTPQHDLPLLPTHKELQEVVS